jgi:hypothetical protein
MKKLCVVCEAPLSGQKKMYCGNTCKQKHHYHRVKTQTNTYHSQTIRAISRKLELIDRLGGKCNSCGYSKNIAALQFHHLDPEVKSFKLGHRMLSNRSWEAILKEVEKCILLCANCHAEEHNPEYALDAVKKTLRGASRRKRRDEQGVNSGKPKP